jgi:hypothetical protein
MFIDITVSGSATIGGLITGGDIISDNWDGTLPLDLSGGADAGASVGYALDGSEGAIQVQTLYAEGGEIGNLDVVTSLTLGASGELRSAVAGTQRMVIEADEAGRLRWYTAGDATAANVGVLSGGTTLTLDGKADVKILAGDDYTVSGFSAGANFRWDIGDDGNTGVGKFYIGADLLLQLADVKVTIGGDVIPNTGYAYDLGTADLGWRDIYGAALNLDNDGDGFLRNRVGGHFYIINEVADGDLWLKTHNGAGSKARIFIQGAGDRMSFYDHDGVEAMKLGDYGGQSALGIGDPSMDAKLDVYQALDNRRALQVGTTDNSASDVMMNFYSDVGSSANEVARMTGDGDWFNDNGSYGTLSDPRTKLNMRPARSYFQDVMSVDIISYENVMTGKKLLGYDIDTVPQGLVKEIPRTVYERSWDGDRYLGKKIVSNDKTKYLKTSVLEGPMLLGAFQEYVARTDARIAALEERIDASPKR